MRIPTFIDWENLFALFFLLKSFQLDLKDLEQLVLLHGAEKQVREVDCQPEEEVVLEHSEHLVESAQHEGVEQGGVDADAHLHQAEHAANRVVATELLMVVVHVLQDLHATGELRSHSKLKGQGSTEPHRVNTE